MTSTKRSPPLSTRLKLIVAMTRSSLAHPLGVALCWVDDAAGVPVGRLGRAHVSCADRGSNDAWIGGRCCSQAPRGAAIISALKYCGRLRDAGHESEGLAR